MNILINAFGISHSGGLRVFNKLLEEIHFNVSNEYYVVIHYNFFMQNLKEKYHNKSNLHFIFIQNKSMFYRLYYENFSFKRLVKDKNIELIYNFTGSLQYFLDTKQLVKVQNLLFFSKDMDSLYFQKKQLFLWFKQVFIKRIIFKLMLTKSKHIEIQSNHVSTGMSDFMKISDKSFYIKSDININKDKFYLPKKYNFLNKISFVYIIGPQFTYLHKNFIDFTNAMVAFAKKGIDFEINITLTSGQVNSSSVWDSSLNKNTNFLGYIDDPYKFQELFCDNTILISTSVVETLGLHVIEGIQNGVITIVPDKDYANAVYGRNMFKYELFNKNSLLDTIMSVINCKESFSSKILSLQEGLSQRELKKFNNILEVFDEVKNV